MIAKRKPNGLGNFVSQYEEDLEKRKAQRYKELAEEARRENRPMERIFVV